MQDILNLVTALIDSKCHTCIHKHNSDSLESLHKQNTENTNTLADKYADAMLEIKEAEDLLDQREKFIVENTDWEKVLEPFIKNNEKIKGIKYIREVTGLDLREAKELADKYMNVKKVSQPTCSGNCENCQH